MILQSPISIKGWGLHPGVFPQGRSFSRLHPPSLLCKELARPWSHTNFSPSLLWPVGPFPALSCPGPGRACHRMAEEPPGVVLLPHMPFVTEEAAFELKFKDFST